MYWRPEKNEPLSHSFHAPRCWQIKLKQLVVDNFVAPPEVALYDPPQVTRTLPF